MESQKFPCLELESLLDAVKIFHMWLYNRRYLGMDTPFQLIHDPDMPFKMYCVFCKVKVAEKVFGDVQDVTFLRNLSK